MDRRKVSDIASSTSNSFAESSVEEKGCSKRSFFKRHGLLRITSNSSGDADISAIDCERDLTPGSLEVWVDLPDAIKYDPALAPFKQLYEQQIDKWQTLRSVSLSSITTDNRFASTFFKRTTEEWYSLHVNVFPEKYDLDFFKARVNRHFLGKLDQHDIENEGDKTIFTKKPDLGPIGEHSETHNDTAVKESEHRLVDSSASDPEKKIKSARQKKIDKALRIFKLAALVAGWSVITISLLLNREKTDTVLHTAVISGVIKEYRLNPTDERVKALITLTGPFSEEITNDTVNIIQIWLHRAYPGGWEENSTIWTIQLQNEEIIDFSPSVTESNTLRIEKKSPDLTNNTNFDDENRIGPNVTLRMYTGSDSTVPLTVTYLLNPLDEEDGIIYATVLLLTLYVLIIFEIVNRTLAALLASSLGVCVLACGGARPQLPELVSWLDVETLLLLFSMMLLVAILAETGLFDYLAVVAFEKTGGKTWPLINCLCFFTAIFSTFLDNVTTVLLMTPVTIRLCEVMQLNPVPVLISMVIFSNVGGAVTPVGDPPNVIIASHPSVVNEGINFTSFTLHMGLGILLVTLQTYLQLRWMYRNMNELKHNVPVDIQEMRQEIAVWRRAAASLSSYSRDEDIVRKALEKQVDRLHTALQKRQAGGASRTDPKFCSTLAQMKQKYKIRDKPLLVKSSICIIFVVAVFFLHAIPQLQSLSLGWTALLGALLLLVLAEREDLEPILARVEWSTLLFFAALFVLMETLSKLGLISWIGKITESLILSVNEESRLAVAIMLVLWVSGLASAFVDNIPLTTMMVRVTAALADPRGLGLPLPPLAWALSFGACLGGNGTLIGASANVVCAGVAEQHGYRFTFLQFLKVGFPIMIGNLIVSSGYLLFCHCLFEWH